MANLKEIRNRIVSIGSTMQITSAMKMVSAAKLKRATDKIVEMRPYAEKLQEILANVSGSLDSSEGIYSQQREVKSVLIVSITSNRGLCGGFNSSTIKEVNRLIAENNTATTKVLSLGKKSFETFAKGDHHYTEGYAEKPFEIFDDLTFENVSVITETIMGSFVDGTFDQIYVVYNKFKNAAVQIVTTEQFLPILPNETNEDETPSSVEYIFEPSKKEIVEKIIPNSLKIQIFKALLDSNAAEHGARMTAMHKATENAKDMQFDLKLHYNKARQAAITNEILEIVGGAEALNA